MLTRRYFRLRSLGQLTVTAVAGESQIETPAAVRPRHLAVLTVLALSSRPIPRDLLLEMFWGGESETRARHSLSNALSGLRSLLGAAAITARRDHVELDVEARLEVDAIQFVAACDRRDDDEAARIYGGSFLAGIYVPDAPEFDHWVARERGRLERLFVELCERRLPVLIRGRRWPEAIDLAERWVSSAPHSTTAFLSLLQAHAGPETEGALSGAIDAYDRVAAVLAEHDGVRPNASIVDFAVALRDRLQRARAANVVPVVVPPVVGLSAPTVAPALAPVLAPPVADATAQATHHDDDSLNRPRGRRRRRWPAAAIGLAVSLVLIALWATRQPTSASESKQPVVAVASIEDVRGDSAVAWLRAGLPRLISADLASLGGIEVVAPSRVRDVVARLAGSSSARLTDDEAIDVARRVGAAWAVTGGISTAKGGYLLDVTIRNIANARETESFTLLSNDPVELGRSVAARLATVLNIVPGSGSPRYAGVETNNADAYRHFIRGMAAIEGERQRDAITELDSAIGLDSGFVAAIRARRSAAGWLGDTSTTRRLAVLERRNGSKLPEIDRLGDELHAADSLGESARADALSKSLIARFPHDPRSYSRRADLLSTHGQWAAAEQVLLRELALDSLAMVAGDGPCTPCAVLWRLSQNRIAQGDRAGAEAAARRWVALQPDLPSTWRNLSATLAAVGKPAEAAEAGYHMVALSNSPPALVDFARTMLSARRYDIVDSLMAAWRSSPDPVLADGVVDIGAMLQRERGQFNASVTSLASVPSTSGLMLLRADGLARVGRLSEARAILELFGHPKGVPHTADLSPVQARGFAWAHALEGDELLRTGDTATARAFTDSVARVGGVSYYDRDKLLSHHLRGMEYFAEGRFADAERELRASEWSAAAWTRTNIELARAQLAERHYANAIATLHDAYLAPLDGMARYVPRSEIDWWMARAFAAAGQRDSAAVYATYVRTAWRRADPAVRARLDSLP